MDDDGTWSLSRCVVCRKEICVFAGSDVFEMCRLERHPDGESAHSVGVYPKMKGGSAGTCSYLGGPASAAARKSAYFVSRAIIPRCLQSQQVPSSLECCFQASWQARSSLR